MSCDHHNGHGCSLGLFGGRPSPGVCATCDQYQGKPRGIGDMVQKVAEKTGIKSLVEKVAGKDCGCAGRRDKLNKLAPFRGES